MFKSLIYALVSLIMIINPAWPGANSSLGHVPKGKQIDLSNFTLVWSDEFEGNELDRSKWDFEWWITERKGGYWHQDMVSVEDGDLVIRAEYKNEPMPNYYPDYIGTHSPEYKPGWYTGEIWTKEKYEQKYGYFEVRCILPAATGMWSAFWLMNDGVFNVDGSGKDGTEVDVFESFYYKDNKIGLDCISSGIHYDGYGADEKGATIGKTLIKNDPYKEYNTYGLEWSPDEYIFYLNGVECGRLSAGGVSQNPEYLLLSCEFAGSNGVQSSDRHGTGKINLTPSKNWPAEFRVDYVRCYQYNDMLQF